MTQVDELPAGTGHDAPRDRRRHGPVAAVRFFMRVASETLWLRLSNSSRAARSGLAAIFVVLLAQRGWRHRCRTGR